MSAGLSAVIDRRYGGTSWKAEVLAYQRPNAGNLARQILFIDEPANRPRLRMRIHQVFKSQYGSRHRANVRIQYKDVGGRRHLKRLIYGRSESAVHTVTNEIHAIAKT